MGRLLNSVIFAFVWLVAWLPISVLFVFSDLLYLVVYRMLKYRRDVVRGNLSHAFPEKRPDEITRIEKRFYRHLCDSFVEWVYPMHRSARTLEKRYRFINPEVINDLYAEGRSVAGVLGHYGNWEYLSLLPEHVNHEVWALYKPLKNKFYDRLINDLRSKYGVKMVPDHAGFRKLKERANAGAITMTYFLADQSPQKSKIKYETLFLNRMAPVFLGPEQIAKKLDMAVVFFDIRKVGRGRYEVHFQLLVENPRDTSPYEITEMHVRALETAIRRDPAPWLWSHRRWKHASPSNESDRSE